MLFAFALALAGATARAAPESCADFRKKLPKGWLQGFAEVPEDWRAPTGRKIKIFYYGKKPPAGDLPTVFFNGGPGESSHASFDAFQATDQGRDLAMIYFDQRGTGCSTPYPVGQDVPTLKRLLLYGSRAIVLDAEAIRKKLFGTAQWRAFGQSYGGYIVHRYLEVAPDGLATALAHGAAIYQDDGEFTKLRLLAQKRSTARFFTAHPMAKAALVKARSQITPTTCFQDKWQKVCGPAILDYLVYFLAYESSWISLSSLMQNLATNIKVALPDFVTNNILTERSTSLLPASVIGLIEAPPESPDAKGRGSCEVALSRLAAKGEKAELWLLNECRYYTAVTSLAQPTNDALSQTTFDPDPFRLDAVLASLKARPKLKLYLYASKNDPLVPADAFVDEAKVLGKLVKFRYLKASGHEGFLTEPRVWKDLEATRKKRR